MIDLNHVALFARVVQAGSFSHAARALGLPKATVSRNIARLEAQLGVRLLHRTTRKLELTGPGRIYYEAAARGLTQVESANQQLAAVQSVPTGTLRITAPIELGNRFLVGWMAEFLASFERVRVELLLSDGLMDLIAERIDVAIRVGRLANSSFIARRLGPARKILLASPGYLERRGEPDRIEDLGHHDCIVFGRSLDHPVWRVEGPDGAREIPVQGRFAIDSAHGALQAVLAGLGIALLPAGNVLGEVRTGALRRVLPDYASDSGAIYVVYPSNRQISAALRGFLDFLIEKADAFLA